MMKTLSKIVLGVLFTGILPSCNKKAPVEEVAAINCRFGECIEMTSNPTLDDEVLYYRVKDGALHFIHFNLETGCSASDCIIDVKEMGDTLIIGESVMGGLDVPCGCCRNVEYTLTGLKMKKYFVRIMENNFREYVTFYADLREGAEGKVYIRSCKYSRF